MAHLLIIEGHPDRESFSAALAASYIEGAGHYASTERLVLGELQFDPVLRGGFAGRQALEPDLLLARAAIERADHVAWFFPTWWAGPPALVKGFIDRVFLPGWAFAYGKGPLPEKLLKGRSARVVTTMDSPAIWYTLAHRRALHGSFVHATLAFVGFSPIRQTTGYSLRGTTPEARQSLLSSLEEAGRRDAMRAERAAGAKRRLPSERRPTSPLPTHPADRPST